MALKTFQCNYLTPLQFKGLNSSTTIKMMTMMAMSTHRVLSLFLLEQPRLPQGFNLIAVHLQTSAHRDAMQLRHSDTQTKALTDTFQSLFRSAASLPVFKDVARAELLRGTEVERRSLANFPCPVLDLRLTGNHICG